MRPHLLELSAFGAFPGEVRLDLDALGESGLVLLCGDTGGGKTTLLDALGFALYGVVPGERQKAPDDLRSHHAPVTAQARVRLELTARGRRLRVTRTPEQHRPKKRGEGTVREHPTALLEQWTGSGWQPLAQSPQDVGLEIGRLLGMDAGQFFQVVVLPQGRFAAFLQADHKEREKLLKKLFHVDRFESVERWLADRAASAATAVDTAQTALAQVAARVAQESGCEPPPDLQAAPTWVGDLSAVAAAEAEGAVTETTRCRSARTAAEQALADAEAMHAAQLARRAAERELDGLLAEAPAVAALADDLDAALRARPVAVAAAGLATAEAELLQAQAVLRDALADVVAAGGSVEAPGERPLATAARAADAGAARLERLVDVQRRARDAGLAVTAAEQACAALRADLTSCGTWLDALPDRRAALQAEVDDARAAALALPGLQVAHDAAVEQQQLAGQLRELEVARAALVDDATRCRLAARTLHEDAERLRNDRVDALIAELAFRLEDDCPCPVCGSLAHPDVPLVLPGAEIGKEAELAARRRAEAAEQAAAAADQALAVHAERLAGVRARVVPGPVPDDAALLGATRSRAALLADAEQRLVLLAAEGEHRYADLARLETRLEEEVKRAAEAAGEQTELVALLTGAGHGLDADLPGALVVLRLLAAALDAADRAQLTTSASRTHRDRLHLSLLDVSVAAGFATPDEAAAAVRPDAAVSDAAARVAAHRDRLAGVRTQLSGLDVPLDAEAPVAPCRVALADAVEAHESAVGASTVLTERAQALAALVTSYDVALQALAPLQVRAATARGLADLVAGRGGNRLSMPLSTFVLAARLEEVAAAASLRLERMSGGRYALRHTDVGRDGRRRSGLGLSVLDGWTGRSRDTATLSGGETFMTALSLALGLADVVTAEAGGQSIDTLFVDEGFGTLDAGSLDQVTDVLDELRSGGRLVGVVSHVADLRQRIPAQVRVHKGVHGSTLSTTLDDG